MTENDFRKLALALPEATEGAHMGHPDFRVGGGKIFATLRAPSEGWATVMLTPDQQQAFVQTVPDAFMPVKGGWGLKGATNVKLAAATEKPVRDALLMAWKNAAPKKLQRA